MLTQLWETPSQVCEVKTEPSVVASRPTAMLVHSSGQDSGKSWADAVWKPASRQTTQKKNCFFMRDKYYIFYIFSFKYTD